MEIDLNLFFNILTALGIGALIGIERELIHKDKHPEVQEFSGFRTHVLIALLGFLGALGAEMWGMSVLVAVFAIVGVFLFAAYRNEYIEFKLLGITRELAAVVALLSGALAFYSPHLATTIAVITVITLALKYPFRKFVAALKSEEFFAAIKFIIIAFIILPLLPRTAVDPWQIVIPYEVWLIVVFVSAISFVGYVLTKLVGAERGIEITGLVGGLASSTATTTSMSDQSRHEKNIVTPFVFAVVISSAVMFVRVGLVVGVLNRELLGSLARTLGVMIAVSLMILAWLWRKSRKQKKAKPEELVLQSPFKFIPALKFAVLFIAILVLSFLANDYFGSSGVLITSAISGLADVDPLVISMAKLSHSGEITSILAIRAITIAVLVNTLVKIGIVAFFGGRVFAKKTALALGLVILSGIASIIWL